MKNEKIMLEMIIEIKLTEYPFYDNATRVDMISLITDSVENQSIRCVLKGMLGCVKYVFLEPKRCAIMC